MGEKASNSSNTPSSLDVLTGECESVRAYCAQLRKSYKRMCDGQIVMKRLFLIILPSLGAALTWSCFLLIPAAGAPGPLAEVFNSSVVRMIHSVAPVLAPIFAVIAAVGVLARVDQPPAPFQNLLGALSAVSLQSEYLLQLGKISPPEQLLPEVKDLQSRLLGMMRLFEPELTSLPKLKGGK